MGERGESFQPPGPESEHDVEPIDAELQLMHDRLNTLLDAQIERPDDLVLQKELTALSAQINDKRKAITAGDSELDKAARSGDARFKEGALSAAEQITERKAKEASADAGETVIDLRQSNLGKIGGYLRELGEKMAADERAEMKDLQSGIAAGTAEIGSLKDAIIEGTKGLDARIAETFRAQADRLIEDVQVIVDEIKATATEDTVAAHSRNTPLMKARHWQEKIASTVDGLIELKKKIDVMR